MFSLRHVSKTCEKLLHYGLVISSWTISFFSLIIFVFNVSFDVDVFDDYVLGICLFYILFSFFILVSYFSGFKWCAIRDCWFDIVLFFPLSLWSFLFDYLLIIDILFLRLVVDVFSYVAFYIIGRKFFIRNPEYLYISLFVILSFVSSVVLFLSPFNIEYSYSFYSWLSCLFDAVSAITGTGMSSYPLSSKYSQAGIYFYILLMHVSGIGFCLVFTWILLAITSSLNPVVKVMVGSFASGDGYISFRYVGFGIVKLYMISEAVGFLFIFYGMVADGSGVYDSINISIFYAASAMSSTGSVIYDQSTIDHAMFSVPITFMVFVSSVGIPVLFVSFSRALSKFPSRKNVAFGGVFGVKYFYIIFSSIFVSIIGGYTLYLLGDSSFYDGDYFYLSFAQSISRSTGFEFLSIDTLSFSSIMAVMSLMVFGSHLSISGSSWGIGFFIMFIMMIKNYNSNNRRLERRSSPLFHIYTGLSFFFFFILTFVFVWIFLLIQPGKWEHVIFEVISALSNSGLTAGYINSLSPASKLVLVLAMLLGRIVPLWLFLSLSGRKQSQEHSRQPAEVMIG